MQNKNNKFAWLSRVVRVGLQPLSTAISVTSLSHMAQTLYTSASRKASMQVLKGLPPTTYACLCCYFLAIRHLKLSNSTGFVTLQPWARAIISAIHHFAYL